MFEPSAVAQRQKRFVGSRRTLSEIVFHGQHAAGDGLTWQCDGERRTPHGPSFRGHGATEELHVAPAQVQPKTRSLGFGRTVKGLEQVRRIVPRLGHAQAIGAITHRLCRLIWKILHERVRYEERGPSVSAEAKKVRARKMIRELRSLGYSIELLPTPPSTQA
jgi:hypothetical protein